jgi:acyl-CoA reductase-like NAD-dependent aldehyde dehydrogenase
VVSAATLESEIAAQADAIDAALRLPNPQKSVRRVLTYSAVLFGVVDRYDQAVAFQAEAHAARDTYARAAVVAKTWDDFRPIDIARLLKALAGNLRTGKPELSVTIARDAGWPQIAARPPIMHRLELAQTERLAITTRDADTVRKNAASIVREAEAVAILARVLQDPDYEFGREPGYRQSAQALETHARECAQAAKAGNGPATIRAYVAIQRACDKCHEAYR